MEANKVTALTLLFLLPVLRGVNGATGTFFIVSSGKDFSVYPGAVAYYWLHITV
jgi:hypothetical protein